MSTSSIRPPDGTLAVYADYVCPFCYLGRESLRRYLDESEAPPAVEWRFYDLRARRRGPDGELSEDVDDGKDDAYFREVRENVRRLADRYGVDLAREVARGVDSRPAQQAALFVRREHGEDAFRAFNGAVFDALWRDGRDVEDPAVLADLAGAVGLDGGAVADAADDDGDLAAALRERVGAAREAGITAVPTFVYGEHAASGAIPPDHLRRLVGDG